MPPTKNWDKIGDLSWKFTEDIPGTNSETYDMTIKVTDHGKGSEGSRYEIAAQLYKRHTKIDGALIGVSNNKNEARKMAVDTMKSTTTVEDALNYIHTSRWGVAPNKVPSPDEYGEQEHELVGKTVAAARPMTEEELEAEYWDDGGFAIEFEDDTLVYASRDEEGNGPGWLINTSKVFAGDTVEEVVGIKMNHWDEPALGMVIDGTQVFPSQDREHNGPGALFGKLPDGTTVVWTAH